MSRSAFALPPLLRTAEGGPRRVGIEIEFMGIGAAAAARALALGLGGRVVEADPHAFHVEGTPLGEIAVELDIRYVHPRAQDASLPLHLSPRLAALLGTALGPVVPCELVTPPVELERLAEVDRAVELLRRAGATGDGATWFGSLGLHFNVEPALLSAGTMLETLRALLLLEPRLRRQTMEGSGRRRFLPAPYPPAYVRKVLAPGYRPGLEAFAADYLAANPTRDRSLDLLPALLQLDPEGVRRRLRFEKIKGRPVFHYRLPRAHVARPGWSLADGWNGWVEVERLAADPARLAEMARRPPT